MEEAFIRPVIKELKDYIPGTTPKESGIIKLASNENPFGPSPKALEALAKEGKNLQVYPDQKSTLLREALAKKLSIDENCIIAGNGSDEIMQIVVATFLKPGEEVVIPQNSFSVYEFVTKLFDGQPVFASLKDSSVDLDAIAKAVSPKTKMIFVANPNNPTGTTFTAKELEDFLSKIPENILIIIDEAYINFVESKAFPDSLKYVKEGRNLLVLRTFSKLYGLAGLRIGLGIAKKELVSFMYRAKLPFNVNRLAQVGAAAALEDKEFANKTYQNNLEGKKYLYEELDNLGLEYKKTEANFIFINLKRSADQIFMGLFKQRVIIRPLTSFGFPEAIRVSIGTMEQNQKFISALKAVL